MGKRQNQYATASSDPSLDRGDMESHVAYQLRRAHFAVQTDFQKTVQDFDVTPGQFGVLTLIALNPGLSQSVLARAIGVERSTMVAVIDRLESLHLVERRTSATDRRSYALILTAKGQDTQKKLARRVQEHDARITRSLNETERETLVTLLSRLG